MRKGWLLCFIFLFASFKSIDVNALEYMVEPRKIPTKLLTKDLPIDKALALDIALKLLIDQGVNLEGYSEPFIHKIENKRWNILFITKTEGSKSHFSVVIYPNTKEYIFSLGK